jgi:hypothetical protein
MPVAKNCTAIVHAAPLLTHKPMRFAQISVIDTGLNLVGVNGEETPLTASKRFQNSEVAPVFRRQREMYTRRSAKFFIQKKKSAQNSTHQHLNQDGCDKCVADLFDE